MKNVKWTLPLVIVALLWAYFQKKEDLQREPMVSENETSPFPPLKSNRQPASSGAKGSAPNPAPSSAAPGLAPVQSVTAMNPMQELRRLKECLQSESCQYPQIDPQSYALGVGQDLKSVLKSLATLVAADPSMEKEAGKAARELMKSYDGHIQEGALAVFAVLPPSSENLQAIVEGLKVNAADPLILEQAGKELSRYVNSPAEPLVHQFFTETLSQGALFTSQKAGVVVKEVLTPQSASQYRQVLKSMRPDSTAARNLRSTLDEYDRQRSGG